jgi:hypothetical protein
VLKVPPSPSPEPMAASKIDTALKFSRQENEKKLIDKLKSWGGVHIESVTRLYDENAENSDFFEDLVVIYKNEQELQKVTTWLIKHHYDTGNKLPDSLTEKLLSTCVTIENWETKLHILQLLPHFELSKKMQQFLLVFFHHIERKGKKEDFTHLYDNPFLSCIFVCLKSYFCMKRA